MGKPRQKKHDEGWPRNLFRRGDSWILDFYFRGQRYTETLGPMSRTTTQEKRDKRRGDIAAGDLVVNGKVWRNKRWEQVDEQPSVEDILFEEGCEKYMEWYKGHSRPRSHERHATSAIALKAAFSGKRLSQISAFAIDKYKLERKAAKKAEATINRELTMLKHLFSKCHLEVRKIDTHERCKTL
jgi:hypothetical protein